MKRAQRALNLIEKDLQSALRTDTKNVLRIGALLLEAKAQVKHGEWFPWLEAQTGASERTAQNYMAAARFATKYATVADLKLRPTALYYLAANEIEAKVRKAIFAEAKEKWVDLEAVYEIESRFAPEPEPPEPIVDYETLSFPTNADEETVRAVLRRFEGIAIEVQGGQVKCSLPVGMAQQAQAALAEAADAAALLDGEGPALPPVPPAAGSPKDEGINNQYKQAVETLDRLATKPIDRWFGLLPEEQVQRVADMLRAIVERARSKAHA
jgi:hypothetical protein